MLNLRIDLPARHMRIVSWIQTLAIIGLLPLIGQSQITVISQPPVVCMYASSGSPTPANCPTGTTNSSITFSPTHPTSADGVTAFVPFAVFGCQGPLDLVNIATAGTNIAISFSIGPYTGGPACPQIAFNEILAVSLGSLAPGFYSVTSTDTSGSFLLTVAPPVALDFYPVTPCRIADTRTGAGFSGQFGPPSLVGGATRIFNILSSPCANGIPSTAAAYSLNFTVVPPAGGQAANLTAYPMGLATGMPNVSTLNYYGSVIANAAIVPAGTNGAINVFATNPTDMLFDINGYFAPPASSGLEFYPVSPCRVADTRAIAGFTGQFGPPSLLGGGTRIFNVPSSLCAAGIPSNVAAYAFNFTAAPPAGGPAANLTAYPMGLASVPNVSTVNYYDSVVANAAIVSSGSGAAINVFASFPTDMLLDINGYFAPALPSGLHFYPVTPCRIADTRTGAGFSGQFGPPSLAGGATRTFNVPSSPCASGIPANAAAYALNFTVVPPSGGPEANLTTWPTGLATGMPNVSTLNYYGSVVAGAAIVPAGANGAINVFASYPTDMLFDINGYFAP